LFQVSDKLRGKGEALRHRVTMVFTALGKSESIVNFSWICPCRRKVKYFLFTNFLNFLNRSSFVRFEALTEYKCILGRPDTRTFY
jgi:hypothetical protein